jgi:hypothetical protein
MATMEKTGKNSLLVIAQVFFLEKGGGSEHKRAWRDLGERGVWIFIFKSLWMDEVCLQAITSFWLSCVCGNVPTDGNQAHPKSDDFKFKLELHLTADNDFMTTLTRFNVVVVSFG